MQSPPRDVQTPLLGSGELTPTSGGARRRRGAAQRLSPDEEAAAAAAASPGRGARASPRPERPEQAAEWQRALLEEELLVGRRAAERTIISSRCFYFLYAGAMACFYPLLPVTLDALGLRPEEVRVAAGGGKASRRV